jgi:hypothetical protein
LALSSSVSVVRIFGRSAMSDMAGAPLRRRF